MAQAKSHSITARAIIAMLIAPFLALTGFRFSKSYRWGVTWRHRAIYALISTVDANLTADRLAFRPVLTVHGGL